MRFRKRAEDHVKVDVDAAASAGAGRARQGARGRASRDRDRRNDKVGRSPEKSHQLTRGEIARPFMSLGNGFRRAVFAVLETRGAPWIMRGSFMRLVSSLAGAVAG